MRMLVRMLTDSVFLEINMIIAKKNLAVEWLISGEMPNQAKPSHGYTDLWSENSGLPLEKRQADPACQNLSSYTHTSQPPPFKWLKFTALQLISAKTPTLWNSQVHLFMGWKTEAFLKRCQATTPTPPHSQKPQQSYPHPWPPSCKLISPVL